MIECAEECKYKVKIFFITSDLSAFLQSSSARIWKKYIIATPHLTVQLKQRVLWITTEAWRTLTVDIYKSIKDDPSCKSTDYVVIFIGVSLHLFLNTSSCSPIFCFRNKFYTIHVRKCNMKTTSAIITTSLPSIYRECKWSWFW